MGCSGGAALVESPLLLILAALGGLLRAWLIRRPDGGAVSLRESLIWAVRQFLRVFFMCCKNCKFLSAKVATIRPPEKRNLT